MLLFRKWNFLCRAVDRGARDKDKPLYAAYARAFEQMQGSGDVCVVIKLRLLNRWSNACTRREMKNRAELFLTENIRDFFAITKIDIVNGDVFGDRRNVRAFDLRIVKIVEIV